MKIVYFVGTLNAGGIERFITRVSKHVVNNQLYEIGIVCLIKKEGIFIDELNKLNVKIIELPNKWNRSVGAMIKAGRILKQEFGGFSLVHSQVNYSLIQQLLIIRFAGLYKFMVTERNTYELDGISRIKKIIQFYILQLMGVNYSANSERVQKHLAKKLLYPSNKIPVINNGIEISKKLIDKNSHNFFGMKKRLKLLYVGRFHPCKGHDYFIKVLQILLQKNISFFAIFLGDGPLKQKMENKIEKFGLGNNVKFEGIVTNTEEYIINCDLLCLFSSREGMPNVVLEAMACGKPVFANPAGNVEELLSNECGYINYSKKPEKTADKLIEIGTNSKNAIIVGANAKKKVKERFSIKATIEKLIFQYKILLN